MRFFIISVLLRHGLLKTLIALGISMLTAINVYCQGIRETVTYINNILRLHTHTMVEVDVENDYYDEILVTDHGQIKSSRLTYNKATNRVVNDGQVGYGYLKSLELAEINRLSFRNIGDIYILSLKCINKSPYCITFSFGDGSSRISEEMNFYINDFYVAKRLEKALLHLLDLARNSKGFYEKDPFGLNE